MKKGRSFIPIADRLVIYSRPDASGCRIWVRGLDSWGYGLVSFNGKLDRAHRVAWVLKYGSIPHGMLVLHKCDVPACLNPDHLFLGTHQDNVADRDRKGRQAHNCGETHGLSKLKTDDVIAIRSSDKHPKELAALYGVSWQNIDFVKRRVTWKHLP